MKNNIIPYLAVVSLLALSACESVHKVTQTTTNAVTDPATTVSQTTTTVAHKTDPFATDTTTRTTQRSLQQPEDSATNKDLRDSN